MAVYLLWHRTSGFNLAAPSVHRYRGCRAIWTAHQEQRPQVHLDARKALESSLIKRGWMAAVKRQLHRVCQGPSHRLRCEKFCSGRRKYTKGWSLTHSAFRETFSPRVIKREDQAWQQTISWEPCQVITHSVKQNIYCLMKLSLFVGKQRLDRCAGGGVEARWA